MRDRPQDKQCPKCGKPVPYFNDHCYSCGFDYPAPALSDRGKSRDHQVDPDLGDNPGVASLDPGHARAGEVRDPCGFFHYLWNAGPEERVGGSDMPRYCRVRATTAGEERKHLAELNTRTATSWEHERGEYLELEYWTRLRYDQLDYSFISNVGWHRFQVLSGPYAGRCVELRGPDMGPGEFAYIPDMPDLLDPVHVEPGKWEAMAGLRTPPIT